MCRFLMVLLCMLIAVPAFAVDIPADSSVGPAPGSPGDGLNGRYWQLAEKEIIADANPMKTQAFDIINGVAPTSTFVATEFNYQDGNDLTTTGEWLQTDAASLVGGDPAVNNMSDGMMVFDGYLAVDAPGAMDFWIGSDDGSVLWVGGEIVVDNDNGHGAPGDNPSGTATFSEAGLYPVQLNYFNGNWVSDAGDNGGANMAWRVGGDAGEVISSSILHTVPEPAAITLLAAALSMVMVFRRRK